MTAQLGVLLPLTADPFAVAEWETLRAVVDEEVIDSVWVRDLPCVPAGDPDAGQGSDPFAHLALLTGAGVTLATVGTASIILGVRHPLVVARAATGLQHASHGRFVLGVGTGGKPEMNRALGIDDRSLDAFAHDWRVLRAALRPAAAATQVGVDFLTPSGYDPPPVHLATSDLRRWEAIDGDADGWQTFATSPTAYQRDYDRVCAIRGAPTDVELRIDATVVPERLSRSLLQPVRGRVSGTEQQIVEFTNKWRQLRVRRILLALRTPQPLRLLQAIGNR